MKIRAKSTSTEQSIDPTKPGWQLVLERGTYAGLPIEIIYEPGDRVLASCAEDGRPYNAGPCVNLPGVVGRVDGNGKVTRVNYDRAYENEDRFFCHAESMTVKPDLRAMTEEKKAEHGYENYDALFGEKPEAPMPIKVQVWDMSVKPTIVAEMEYEIEGRVFGSEWRKRPISPIAEALLNIPATIGAAGFKWRSNIRPPLDPERVLINEDGKRFAVGSQIMIRTGRYGDDLATLRPTKRLGGKVRWCVWSGNWCHYTDRDIINAGWVWTQVFTP
jgi:hypothetical protein